MTTPATQAAEYLIRKGGAYYRPNAEGYTNNVEEAGRYTLAEAIRHSHPNGPDGPRDGIDFMSAPVGQAHSLPGDVGTVDIRAIAFAAIQRARKAGESQEMLARWISEDIHAALTPSAPRCQNCGIM